MVDLPQGQLEYHYYYVVSSPPEVGVGEPPVPAGATMVEVDRALAGTTLVSSRSEASRLINQGAVEIDGKKVTSNKAMVQSGSIIKVGKRRYLKVIID